MSRLKQAADLLGARKAAAWGVQDLDDLAPATTGDENVIARVLVGEGFTAAEVLEYAQVNVHCFMRLFGPLCQNGEAELEVIAASFWLEGLLLGMMLAKVPDE
jgi:hypothetical protein